MKKVSFVLTLILGCLLTFESKAQTAKNDFTGDWDVTIMGSFLSGDGPMDYTFVFEEDANGNLSGRAYNSEDVEISKIWEVKTNQENKSLTAMFNPEGFEVNIALNIVENDQLEGSLMDFLKITGKRKE